MTPRSRILGTAGHIDHGKTALIRALTGTDTDRLPEEQARGITIDIGFAHLELESVSYGVIDVPGHERFVRNMLAGATGVDVALLVVAADDSVMPQTREHLAILELLGVTRGVIALTKCDRAEPSWIDLVEAEVRELVSATGLAAAPIVRTSAHDGTGIDALRDALRKAADDAEPRAARLPFRLAVDRAFVRQGVGTVVTGTVASGAVAVGDEVAWLPSGERVTVRGIHAHGAAVERAARGERAALNLPGVHHESIHRGHELAAPEWLRGSSVITARVALLPDAPRALVHRARVRVHLGAQEMIARFLLFDGTRLEPGATAWAQFIGAAPFVARAGQPFVLRSESPVVTIGGGHVAEPVTRRIARRDRGRWSALPARLDPDPAVRAAAALERYGAEPWQDLELARDADLVPDDVPGVLDALRSSGAWDVVEAGQRTLRVATPVLRTLEARVEAALQRLHDAAPLEDAIPLTTLPAALPGLDERVVPAVVRRLEAARRVHRPSTDVHAVALRSFKPALTARQRAARDHVIAALRDGAFRPPDVPALARDLSMSERDVRPIVELCVSRGDLVHLGGGVYLHEQWATELAPRVRAAFGAAPFTMGELRETLETSRKFAVPIGEYLDRTGVTRRQGDQRALRAGTDMTHE